MGFPSKNSRVQNILLHINMSENVERTRFMAIETKEEKQKNETVRLYIYSSETHWLAAVSFFFF